MDISHIEWENSGLTADGYSSVIVPVTESPLTDEQMAALREVVDPRAASQSFGCDISMLLLFNFVSMFYLKPERHTHAPLVSVV